MTELSLGVASLFVLYLVFVAPVLGPRRFQRIMKMIALYPARRARLYLFMIAGEWFLVIVVGIIALLSAVPFAAFGLHEPIYGWLNDLDAPAYTFWLFTLFLIIAMWLLTYVGVIGTERALNHPEHAARLLRQIKLKEMLPHTELERRLWLLVSISAGVCEEIVFRGFMPWYFLEIGSIFRLQISFLLALAFSTLIFALIHSYQGWRGIVFAGVIGVICAFIYFITDSLLLAMVYHVLIDARLALTAPTLLRLLAQDEQPLSFEKMHHSTYNDQS
jgi:membrane protease YdiL (CAAX protease family)